MAYSRGHQKLMLEAAGTLFLFVVGAAVILNLSAIRARFAPTAGEIENRNREAARKPAPASEGIAVTGSTGTRIVELAAQRGGHFFVGAEINGRRVEVMVDTGATMVALTYDDAVSAGVSPRPSDFTHQVSTANGVAKIAPIRLERVQIGSIVVRDVAAAVLEQGKLSTTLLGMSFLSKLSSFQMKQGKLVLEE